MAAAAGMDFLEVESQEGSDIDMDACAVSSPTYAFLLGQTRGRSPRSGRSACGLHPQRSPGVGVLSVLAVVALAPVATWLLVRQGRPRPTSSIAAQGKEELAMGSQQGAAFPNQGGPFASYTPAPARIATAPGPVPGTAPGPAAGVGTWAIGHNSMESLDMESLDAWPQYAPSPGPSRQEGLPSAGVAGPQQHSWGVPRAAPAQAPPRPPAPAPSAPPQPVAPAPVAPPPPAPAPSAPPQPVAPAPAPPVVEAVPPRPRTPAPEPEHVPPRGPATYTGVEAGAPGRSLFCYALMIPHSYEQTLLAAQHQRRVSLFACDEYALYSNEALEVAPGLWTNVVDSDLKCRYGGEFKTALNTPIFLTVWRKVISERRYLYHDWTVKTDPDAVFLPARLRVQLLPLREGPTGVYLNNCKFGMHGPLEVFSRNAVTTWGRGIERCTAHFNALCSGPCQWGEDMFIDQCLMKVLFVRRINDFQVLQEDHCDPPYGWKSCRNNSIAAFHPFKDLAGYLACLSNAQAAGMA